MTDGLSEQMTPHKGSPWAHNFSKRWSHQAEDWCRKTFPWSLINKERDSWATPSISFIHITSAIFVSGHLSLYLHLTYPRHRHDPHHPQLSNANPQSPPAPCKQAGLWCKPMKVQDTESPLQYPLQISALVSLFWQTFGWSKRWSHQAEDYITNKQCVIWIWTNVMFTKRDPNCEFVVSCQNMKYLNNLDIGKSFHLSNK